MVDGDAGAEPVIVDGDGAGLRTLLSNLVANAVRYTPEGGRIDVAAAVDEGVPTLAVRDSGPGIPPSERERVFDRFYRAAANDTQGSGLGLAIVRSVADRHGAEIALGAGLDGRGLGVTVRFRVLRPSARRPRKPPIDVARGAPSDLPGSQFVLFGIRPDGHCPIKSIRLRCRDRDRYSARCWAQRRERVQARNRPFSPGWSTGAIGHERAYKHGSKFSR